jgi:hypothetical protein
MESPYSTEKFKSLRQLGIITILLHYSIIHTILILL